MRNRRPLFFASQVQVEGAKEVGNGHLKLQLRRGGTTLEAIGFGLTRRLPPRDLEGRTVDAAFHLEETRFRGRTSIQARLHDLRAPAEFAVPSASGNAGAP